MSMSTLTFHCTDCQFAASSMYGWGIYQYTDGITTFDINRCFGWCESCKNIISMEVLPTKDELREQLQIKLALQSKLESLTNKATIESDWVRKLLGISPRLTDEMKDVISNLKDIKEKITSLTALLVKMQHRQSGATCLDCGSEHVWKLPSFMVPEQTNIEDKSKAVVIMPHPNCTGTIKVSYPDIRFMMRLKIKQYDFEANLIAIQDA